LLCDAWQGLRARAAARRCDIRILVINAARETRWEAGSYPDHHRFTCPALASDLEWKRLGWIMDDDSLPLDELDAVDPELAQFDNLPLSHSRAANPHGVPV
jgi:hypothetical protein